MAAGTWLELSVEADQEAVEAVSAILDRAAPGGVSVEVPFALIDEGLGAQPRTDAPATLRAYLPGIDAAAARAAIERVERDLGHLQAFGLRPIGELTVQPVHEEDWAAAWKQHFPVLRVGRRLVIRPTWRRHRSAPDDVVLALDPGMAFGTGLHPTTRLCLAGIERWADAGLLDGARALDVGCGSGILAIAAARLGARSVHGVDTDPIAVDATIANARRNRVLRRVTAAQGSVPLTAGGQGTALRGGAVTRRGTSVPPFDLVLANLIASLLGHLAPALAASLRPGGRMLASGIFIDREPEVIRAFETAGLEVLRRDQETDWVLLDVVRPVPGSSATSDGPSRPGAT
ncbi:MAG: 50S ribosomal protein L11 methyltransferase [Chloroflexi bacterium]|nr:50S ribosomal protein L11 methyltransferase [Chloroflexota bacterium]